MRPNSGKRPARGSSEKAVSTRPLAASRARKTMTVTLVDEGGREHEVAMDRVAAVVLRLSESVYLEVTASDMYREAFRLHATPDESRAGSPNAGAFSVTAGAGNVLHVRVLRRLTDAATSGHPTLPKTRSRSRQRSEPERARRGGRGEPSP